ncbi:MAG: VWA domain-containing protein [Pyrinomonadaceae bacterium]
MSFSVLAQSGRKASPSPTPKIKTEEPATFSESKPGTKRPPRVFPANLRSSNTVENAKSADAATDENTIKVNTNLITIPVSVFDRNGLYIPNLRQDEFKIFEDGVEQQIAYFSASEKPITVALLLDTSYSTEYKIDEIRTAAKAFVDQLKIQDRVMVVEFRQKVKVRTELTTNRVEIYKGIDKADFGSGTSIYEAVDETLREHLSKVEGRKAIVIFTDGVDTTSKKATFDSTLDYAEESDSLIFPIYYNTFGYGVQSPSIFGPAPGTTAAEYAVGKKYVDELAEYTGGRVFLPETTPGGLTRAFEGIAEELRRQYNIGYIPTDDGRPGQRKQIKIRVGRPNLLIRSRDSYIVGTSK